VRSSGQMASGEPKKSEGAGRVTILGADADLPISCLEIYRADASNFGGRL
jgi:hypothetical protein